MRRARDSNPHTLAGGGFQDRCNTIMRALQNTAYLCNILKIPNICCTGFYPIYWQILLILNNFSTDYINIKHF